jgi:ABC-type Fe3+/spermidine/putrescine transport system ATPase subunit
MAHSVSLNGLSKKFGSHVVLNSVSLQIEPGELLALLGPSGCGKTTLLRAIAGLYQPDAGSVHINGQDITHRPPYQRDMGMVFQNFAVFPHLSVAENVAYGLKVRGCSGSEIQSRIDEALRKVKLDQLKQRFPSDLSGGQKQRVGLARAMVIKPTMLLMDEPLSNLDAKLRIEMRQEIRLLQRELGITTLYVTHDQEEALAVSDRIAVMNSGDIVQLGTPEHIYSDPLHAFVMDFVGGCNWVKGTVDVTASGICLQTHQNNGVSIDGIVLAETARKHAGHEVLLGIRFDAIAFSNVPAENGWRDTTVLLRTYLGSHLQYTVRTRCGIELLFNTPSAIGAIDEGGIASVGFSSSGAYLFDAASGKRLV